MTTDFGDYIYDITQTTIRALLKKHIRTDRDSTWLPNQESLYVESVLSGLPLTPIVLTQIEKTNDASETEPSFKVLDGVCRLTALRNFYENKLRLMDVKIEPILFNKIYSDFFGYKQELFLNTLFPLVVFESGLPKNIEKEIRLRYS